MQKYLSTMAPKIFCIPLIILFVVLTFHCQPAFGTSETKHISYSTRGIECTSPCTTKDADYHWCYLVTKGWDYCSTSPSHDYKGNKCQNSCSMRGKSYKWCAIDGGSWGYCSLKGHDHQIKHFGSTTGKKCSSKCDRHGHSYYWCRTDEKNWDYCSHNVGLNSAGTKCKTPCGKEGDTSYTWCHDKNKKWQYCSPVTVTEGNNPKPNYYVETTEEPRKVYFTAATTEEFKQIHSKSTEEYRRTHSTTATTESFRETHTRGKVTEEFRNREPQVAITEKYFPQRRGYPGPKIEESHSPTYSPVVAVSEESSQPMDEKDKYVGPTNGFHRLAFIRG